MSSERNMLMHGIATGMVLAVFTGVASFYFVFGNKENQNLLQSPQTNLVQKVENMPKKFSIGSSNVWTLTAGDYVKMRGKELKDYEISTLQFNTRCGYMDNIPNNVEAITDLKKGEGYNFMGTLLIPKERKQ
jgi:hypothetical protein